MTNEKKATGSWFSIRNFRDFWSWKIAITTSISTTGWVFVPLITADIPTWESWQSAMILFLIFIGIAAIMTTVFAVIMINENDPGEGKFFERSAVTGMGLVSMAIPLDLIAIAMLIAIWV